MNLEEYKAFVEAQRKESKAEAFSAILQATKKEGSK
jgi:hypothetical protein